MSNDADQLEVATEEHLTFQWLYERVQGLVDHSIYPKAGPVERWSLRVGAIAGAVGLVAGLLLDRWVPVSVLLPATLICLVIEVGGFAVHGALSAKRQYQQYLQPRLSHAKEMDSEYLQWESVLADIRQFPRSQREQRLRFVSSLRTSMVDRMGLLYGGVQRLGPFPLLIAFYVQYRSWQKNGWAGVFDVGLAGGILILFMVLLYVMAWLLISQRVRVETYISLLEASLQDPETNSPSK
ncbi:hypothetical protein [Stenotrophomonas sp. S41]|uniref:hypothetical protein n=1 Tax=Stenotrophomonas sp. S41 TaxID=2767464 RepID=UPI00190CA0A4|nr:hypothetical protein [Stenotrophomonas sp. S41]MBK0013663.1 hypothetical protein [Stenotrophomonas sp. S41]